ncbi:MAG: carbohydrate ABC transporter permease [Bacillota bacterium]|nr:carbohydrate ABC transporter permease [Bacillota bacterium]
MTKIDNKAVPMNLSRSRHSPYYTSRTVDMVFYIVVGILSVITLYPFIFVISSSLSSPMSVITGRVWLYPIGFSTKAYARLFTSSAIWRAFFNSVAFTGIVTTLNVLNSMLAGYALSKPGLVFRKMFVVMILIPMYFSGGLIPSFINIVNLGMYNTPFAIILPMAMSMWNIILARTFISRLPGSLKESAIIDGAGELSVFVKIILPLSKPIMAVLALYTALAVWNNWFSFMIYLPQRPDLHPLQMFLTKALIWGNMNAALQMADVVDPEMLRDRALEVAVNSQLKYAVMVVATVPIMLVYPFVQKYFIQGALLGSLKE